MGFQSFVFGRILIENSIDDNKNIIQQLDTVQAFPWIYKEMFHFCEHETLVGGMIITFGATYKELEADLNCWIMKFEDILQSLDFNSAKIQIETELFGTWDLFWKSKKYWYGTEPKYEEFKLISCDKWYFGFGKRSMWGTLESLDSEDFLTDVPFRIVEMDKTLLSNILFDDNKFTFQRIISDKIEHVNNKRLSEIITYLKIKKKVEWEDGYYKLKCTLDEIDTL